MSLTLALTLLAGPAAQQPAGPAPAPAPTPKPAPVPEPADDPDAERGLKVKGSLRLRFEAIDGQARTGFNRADDLFSARLRLAAEYRAGAVRIGGELFDSRAYGANRRTPLTSNEVNALELVQAYVAADLGPATLQAGRFIADIGSRRLVSAQEYRNTTNAYTGLRADLRGQRDWTATLLYVLPQQRRPEDLASLRDNEVRPDREGFDQVLWGGSIARAHALGQATAELSFFHLGERDTARVATRNRSLDTVSARLVRAPEAGVADMEVEAIYQTGSVRSSTAADAARRDVRAGFVHAELGYTLAGAWKPRLSVEYDHATGNGGGRRVGRFDTLFGARRSDLGPSGIYSAVARSNVVSPGLRLEVEPSKRLDAFAGYRALWLESRTDAFSGTGVADPTGRSGRFAGHQLDARLRYWVVPDRLRVEVDGTLLAKGAFLRNAPNATPGRTTRYLSLNVTTSF